MREVVRDLVTVQDLSAGDLVQLTQQKLGLTYLDPDFLDWEFILNECGKTYEAKVWSPGREMVPDQEVRSFFAKEGYLGNAAAFMVWLTKHNPKGCHSTILSRDLLYQSGDNQWTPAFTHGYGRSLTLCYGTRRKWGAHWSYVAFKEVAS